MINTKHPHAAALPNKATNKKQLAEEMGISPATLRRHLEKAGLKVPRGLISPQLRKDIFEKLGWREMT